MNAWHDRHAQIDVAAVGFDAEAAVLRHAPLRDIEFGQYFQARNDLLGHFNAIGRRCMVEHAVDPVFHGETAGGAFQVDVGRACLQGIVQGRVDQFDGRAGRFGHRRERQDRCGFAVTLLHLRAGHQIVDRADRFFLFGQIGLDIGLQREMEVDRCFRLRCQPCMQVRIERVGDDALHLPIGGAQQDAMTLHCLRQRQQIEGRRQRQHVGGFHHR